MINLSLKCYFIPFSCRVRGKLPIHARNWNNDWGFKTFNQFAPGSYTSAWKFLANARTRLKRCWAKKDEANFQDNKRTKIQNVFRGKLWPSEKYSFKFIVFSSFVFQLLFAVQNNGHSTSGIHHSTKQRARIPDQTTWPHITRDF